MSLRQYASLMAMGALVTALVTGAVVDPGRPKAPGDDSAVASPDGTFVPAPTGPPAVEIRALGDAGDAAFVPAMAQDPADPRPDDTRGSAPGPAEPETFETPQTPQTPQTPETAAPAPDPTSPGVVTGLVEHLWADEFVGEPDAIEVTGANEETPVLQTWLATDGRRLRLLPGPLDTVEAGSSVEVTLGAGTDGTGYPVDVVGRVVAPLQAAVDGVTIGAETLLDFGALPSAVTHEVTVVLAVPAGATSDGTTITSFRDRVAGPVNDFWSAQSRGQRAITVTGASSWVSLTSSCSGSPFDLWNEVAARVGWSSGPRKHLLVYLPTSAGCGAGLGTVGASTESGGLMWVSYNSTDVIAHEFGHNLGLGHSNGLLCPSSSDGTYSGGWTGGCATHGYRDYYDVMGVSWGNIGSLAATHADRLGVVSSSAKVTVTAPTRVRLTPISGEGLRVVKINDPAGTYYVEYRPATANDAWLTGNWRGLDPGVLVRRVNPADGRESLLLDGSVTAGTRTSDWQAALGVGRTLTTASGRSAVTVETADGGGATIAVSIDGQGPSAPVGAPTDGSQVTFSSPANGATVAAGVTTFTGIATAPGGSLLWEVTQNGAVRASGYASTGGNGTFDTFSFPVSLPAGSYTVRAWVPDESSGEGPGLGGAQFTRSLTITVT